MIRWVEVEDRLRSAASPVTSPLRDLVGWVDDGIRLARPFRTFDWGASRVITGGALISIGILPLA